MNRIPTIQAEIATQQRVIVARRHTTVRLDVDTALEARREKVRQVKQGMMQVRLTGKVRLVGEVPEKVIPDAKQFGTVWRGPTDNWQ